MTENGSVDIEANYQRVLGKLNVIMLAPAGSELLGLNQEGQSDRDEMGICLETPQNLLGFSNFEQQVYRSAAERTGNASAPSQDGDIDSVVYGLRKFTRLALSGNPNIIGMLWIPKEKCMVYTPIAEELQGLRKHFVCKSTAGAFLGYMRAQRERLLGERGQRDVNRRHLVEKYGFDTKYAMHLLRLGYQCYQLMRGQDLQFPMAYDMIKYLQQVRTGSYDLSEIVATAKSYEEQIEGYMDNPATPRRPDHEVIEKWLLSVYERNWYDANLRDQRPA